MKNKGFTLIELLAVIVILAIIALIAMPLVLNTIEKAREGAAEASAYAYAEEVERYIILSELDPTLPKLQTGVEYQLSSKKYEVAALADPTTTYINDLVSIKGDKPTEGYLKLNSEYRIEKMEMTIKSYPVTCENDECKITGSKVEEEEKEEEKDKEEISESSILYKAKALVYDENGTCKTDGTTYNYIGGCYIKGANSSNYVWYNGFMWRIMGINSDGTVRMITDENVTALAYGPANSALTYTTNKGYVHDWLNEYFYNNLNSTKSIIKNGSYFCSESTNGETLTEGRKICAIGSEITTKIGTISVDEYLLAGGPSSYLVGQEFWTMTPYNNSNAWFAAYYNNAGNLSVATEFGVRPIINVSSNANVTSGEGTTQSFYVLEEDKTISVNGKLNKKATSGEYVKLEGHTYRVVSKNSNGTKLILDEFYEEPAGTIYVMRFGTNNTLDLDSWIGKKMNNDVLEWLGLSNSDKIMTTTYYQGDGFVNGATYYDTLKQSNGVQAKVGLIQIGDVLAAQSSTMLTKNYTMPSSCDNVKYYWTMSKYTRTNLGWLIVHYGEATFNEVMYEYALRPVITVRNDLDITSGTGTWKNPYQV